MTDQPGRWRRSSRCEAHNCVEVAFQPGRVLVRSSRNVYQVMVVTPSVWRSFCRALRDRGLTG